MARLSGETQLAYQEWGQGPETLLFIHGLSSNLQVWTRNLPVLSARYRCIAVDLPGYGQSPALPGQVSLQRFSALLIELLYQLGATEATLLGHSMGGQVALTAALRYPRTVRRLVLAAPAGFERFRPGEKRLIRRSFLPATVAGARATQLRKNLRYSFYRYTEAAAFMVADRLAMLEEPERLRAYAQTVSRSVDAMLDEPVFDRLCLVQQPVLVLFGEQDPLIPNRLFRPLSKPRRIAQAGVAQLPQGSLQMLPACGHFVPFEQAEAFNQAVAFFLARA